MLVHSNHIIYEFNMIILCEDIHPLKGPIEAGINIMNGSCTCYETYQQMQLTFSTTGLINCCQVLALQNQCRGERGNRNFTKPQNIQTSIIDNIIKQGLLSTPMQSVCHKQLLRSRLAILSLTYSNSQLFEQHRTN